MKRDTRLSSMLHVLLHMAELDRAMVSADLARFMDTNPVVVRRTMGGLREAGLVVSEKGHGGGWRLARPLDRISLADVYRALGAPDLFSFANRNDAPQCLLERGVNSALADTMQAAEALILARLGAVTLQDLHRDLRRRHPAGTPHKHKGSDHA